MIVITDADVKKVLAAGRLSFRVLSNGEFRCNQLWNKGRLTASEKNLIRSAMITLRDNLESQPESKSAPGPIPKQQKPNMRTGQRHFGFAVLCRHCRLVIMCVYDLKPHTCGYCERTFRVKDAIPRPLAQISAIKP